MWHKFRRTNIAEMRNYIVGEDCIDISISQADRANGSPKEGDMVARNPDNHKDMWLVSEQYVKGWTNE